MIDPKLRTNCLPVFYVNLDPADIPTGEDMDTFPVHRALVFLNTLRRIISRADTAAGVDLWPRLWQWARFLHTYRDWITPLEPRQLEDVSRDLLFFVAAFGVVREVVVHAWSSLVGDISAGETHEGYMHSDEILRHFMAPREPTSRAELLDATDGPRGLAYLILRQSCGPSST
ncbi:hypothetical protein C8R47DRAFT_810219 [Mycena vitilis]|nr:hypothetical protein C8R47DRAFT_810219 [Mycena vitilis]